LLCPRRAATEINSQLVKLSMKVAAAEAKEATARDANERLADARLGAAMAQLAGSRPGGRAGGRAGGLSLLL
jgi:hypothetical protein